MTPFAFTISYFKQTLKNKRNNTIMINLSVLNHTTNRFSSHLKYKPSLLIIYQKLKVNLKRNLPLLKVWKSETKVFSHFSQAETAAIIGQPGGPGANA
jgi:hypothetical protein